MRIKKLSIFVLSLAFFGLLGCQTKHINLALPSDDEDVRTAEVKLANSANEVSQSLQELAAIERTNHPAAKVPNPLNPDTVNMGQILSIDWTGPVAPLVRKIAKISQYRVRILGAEPAIPIIVSITATNTPLADILRDANYQCGQRANIAVYSANRIIELRYAKS